MVTTARIDGALGALYDSPGGGGEQTAADQAGRRARRVGATGGPLARGHPDVLPGQRRPGDAEGRESSGSA